MLQIQYLGILESIQVRKASYPKRYPYRQFFQNYQICDPKFEKVKCEDDFSNNYQQLCKALIDSVFPNTQQSSLLFGKTKLYLKMEFENLWDKKRFDIVNQRISRGITKLQAIYKGKKQQKKYRAKVRGYRKLFAVVARVAQEVCSDTLAQVQEFAECVKRELLLKRRQLAISTFETAASKVQRHYCHMFYVMLKICHAQKVQAELVQQYNNELSQQIQQETEEPHVKVSDESQSQQQLGLLARNFKKANLLAEQEYQKDIFKTMQENE